MNPVAEWIKDNIDLVGYMTTHDPNFKRDKGTYKTLCWNHADHTPSLRIIPNSSRLYCDSCNWSGTVIDAIVHFEGLTEKQVFEKYHDQAILPPRPIANQKPPPPIEGTRVQAEDKPTELVATYSYQDEFGDELFWVKRYNPKGFSQGHTGPDGEDIKNLKGIDRVPYNLPNVLKSDVVWIGEGEKDCDSLHEYEAIVATTNPGGSGNWTDAYSQFLEGKEVVLAPDNDDAGKIHLKKVLESVSRLAKVVKIVTIPSPHKDITDYLEAGGRAKDLVDDAVVLYGGIEIPIYSEAERDTLAQKQAKLGDAGKLDLNKWLKGFGNSGFLYPGDLAVLLGATGCGKSSALQGIAHAARPLTVLFFQLELTAEQIRFREVGMRSHRTALEIRQDYAKGHKYSLGKDDHIYCWDRTGLTPEIMEKAIIHSELKIGKKPEIILVDYLQLMVLEGKHSRYERFSTIAESLKRIAKSTSSIVIVASQVQRSSTDEEVILGLQSGKETGSIENSATLLFGIERVDGVGHNSNIPILKYTRGNAGFRIPCNLNSSLNITEVRHGIN